MYIYIITVSRILRSDLNFHHQLFEKLTLFDITWAQFSTSLKILDAWLSRCSRGFYFCSRYEQRGVSPSDSWHLSDVKIPAGGRRLFPAATKFGRHGRQGPLNLSLGTCLILLCQFNRINSSKYTYKCVKNVCLEYSFKYVSCIETLILLTHLFSWTDTFTNVFWRGRSPIYVTNSEYMR